MSECLFTDMSSPDFIQPDQAHKGTSHVTPSPHIPLPVYFSQHLHMDQTLMKSLVVCILADMFQEIL